LVVRDVPTWILEFTRSAELKVARPTTLSVLCVRTLWASMKPLPDIVTGPWNVVKPVTFRLFVTLSEFVILTVLANVAVPPTFRFPPTNALEDTYEFPRTYALYPGFV
jgi:hypothetical protein